MKSKDQQHLEEDCQKVLRERDELSAASVMARQIHMFIMDAEQDKARSQKLKQLRLPLTTKEKIKALQNLAKKTGGVIVGGVYMGDVALEHGYITPEEKQMFDAVAMPRDDMD